MELIDGKKTAEEIEKEIAREVAQIIDSGGKPPHLAAILVGSDPASETYVNNKKKACERVGMISSVYKYEETISEEKLFESIDFLNTDKDIDGMIVQLPLPKHISSDKVIQRIRYEKDVDGFHPVNVGKMTQGLPCFLPATPAGIIELLKRYNIEVEGKHCVVIGRSNIVGTPISILLSRKAEFGNATVTLCHSKTKNIKDITRQADILIAAIGQPKFVSADMVKDDVVVIDVGIHRVPSTQTTSGYKLIGDVDFDEVSKKARYITPVPGGVGPMTIVSLLKNTLFACKKEFYK